METLPHTQVLHTDFHYSIETEIIKFSKITVNSDIGINIFNIYIKCIVKVYHVSFYDSKNTHFSNYYCDHVFMLI